MDDDHDNYFASGLDGRCQYCREIACRYLSLDALLAALSANWTSLQQICNGLTQLFQATL